jgi:hypothetical protein
MVDELSTLVERVRQQSETVQRHIAALIEQALEQAQADESMRDQAPESYAGAWSDLPDDDEFDTLDKLRHETPPSPPVEEQLAWLDDE